MKSLGGWRLACILVLAFGPANLCLSAATIMAGKVEAKAHSCCEKSGTGQKQTPDKCKYCDVVSITTAAKAEQANVNPELMMAFAVGPAIQIFNSVVVVRSEGAEAVPLCRALLDLVHTSCQLTV